MKATRLMIEGTVQGVGFRYFAQRVATGLGLTGYVRNLPDGRVEAVALGPPEAIRSLIHELRRGPRGARVGGIESSQIDLDEASPGFEIRH
ncbi:MAG TPA: acylphosphatase [Candidatus Polarisedimenticolia bacterium]|nr:acylphosphatase [Candidatus Polarisedimenticolia bacterium]